MKSPLPEADLKRALEGLKDFQRRTVDHVFQRMYLDASPARRMLISDEVGLGKTLVARGVIARAIEHLWDKVRQVDVVYICSNGDIARQNVNRLRVLSGEDGGMKMATRLTMLAPQLAKLGPVNFIALTPGTSFDLKTNLGVASERAMLYWLLREAWGFGGNSGPYNVLRGYASSESFRNRVSDSKPTPSVLQAVAGRFSKALEGEAGLRDEFIQLCDLFGHDRKHIPREENIRRNQFVGRVRAVLAETCVQALQPDLVILDEFQRFKHLMSDETDTSLLARKLFNYSDEHGEAKVLLLSATPYKMLTLASQGDDEDHYKDFLDTLRFLQPDKERFAGVSAAVEAFRLSLLRLRSGGGVEELLAAKREMEGRLRSSIVRTERLAASEDRSGMLVESQVPARLDARDVEAYVTAQRVSDAVGDRDVMEYWKSAPYVMNFLDGYKVREKLHQAAKDPALSRKIATIVGSRQGDFLATGAVRDLEPVAAQNARLRAVLADTVDRGAWRMLWVPPCMPAYRLSGAYADPGLAGFTKQLVFSSWRMVPRAVATLVSHAAAHKAVDAFENARGRPSAGLTRWPTPLLRFQVEAGRRLTGMPLFQLIFPSASLAAVNPRRLALDSTAEGLPSLNEVYAAAEGEIARKLALLPVGTSAAAGPDERWYWMAPLLLDLAEDRPGTEKWLKQKGLAAIWAGSEADEEEQAHWDEHVQAFCAAATMAHELGPRPADLARVLAEAVVGSPAVLALRTLRQLVSGSDSTVGLTERNEAAAIAWEMRNLYNLPDSIAVLRSASGSEPYWRRVMLYGAEGGLQAVLDEYAHVLMESLGLTRSTPEEVLTELGAAIRGALGLRSGAVGADEYTVSAESGKVQISTHRLRARFAMPFADAKAEDAGGGEGEGEVTRMEKVREAFNSPFWPFVLVSTSVGQEGLDFHPYCHSVVHWNLPTNPVDLEQREGRVHRYKGHAVRKNVAMAFGHQAKRSEAPDKWAAAFAMAAAGRPAGSTDMVPYWIYPVEGGAKIERRVPALPLSRDLIRMADLRRTLAVYRVVFGQPRQDDLIEFLTSRFQGEELNRICDELRVDLSPD